MLFKQCSLSTYKGFCNKYNIKVNIPMEKELKLQVSDSPPDESWEIDGAITYNRETKKYEYNILVEDEKKTYKKKVIRFLMEKLGSDFVVDYGTFTHKLLTENYLRTLTGAQIEIHKDILRTLFNSDIYQIMYLFILENIEQYKKFLASNKLNTNDSSNCT